MIYFFPMKNFFFSKFHEGKAIFSKYFFRHFISLIFFPSYKISFLPGIKEGISGTSIFGNNIGIVKNISPEKKEAAINVLKYFTNKEYQRELFDTSTSLPPLKEIWDNETICKEDLCHFGKNDINLLYI